MTINPMFMRKMGDILRVRFSHPLLLKRVETGLNSGFQLFFLFLEKEQGNQKGNQNIVLRILLMKERRNPVQFLARLQFRCRMK